MAVKKAGDIQAWTTTEVALKETTDIKSLLTENKGKYVAIASPDGTKKKMSALAKKLNAELSEFEKAEYLEGKQLKRVEEISKIARQNRYALQNVKDHNVSVLAQASRDEKATIDGIILLISPTETKADAIVEAEKQRAKIAKEKREKDFKDLIEAEKVKLEAIVTETENFDQIDTNIEKFRKQVAESDKIDFAEFKGNYSEMVQELTVIFDDKTKEITAAHELAESKKAENVATLRADRMQELFDYDFKYKDKKPLGELDGDEYEDILNEAKIIYVEKDLKPQGFEYLDNQERNSKLVYIKDGVITEDISLEDIKFWTYEELMVELIRLHESINNVNPPTADEIEEEKAQEEEDNEATPIGPHNQVFSNEAKEVTEAFKPEAETSLGKRTFTTTSTIQLTAHQIQVKDILIKFSTFRQTKGNPIIPFTEIVEFLKTI